MQFVKSYLMYPYKLYDIDSVHIFWYIEKIYICQYYIYVNYIYNIHRISTHNCCIYTLVFIVQLGLSSYPLSLLCLLGIKSSYFYLLPFTALHEINPRFFYLVCYKIFD